VQVRVLKVGLEKKQISLTMRTPERERRPAAKPRPARRPAKREATPVAGDAKAAAVARAARPERPPRPQGERPKARPLEPPPRESRPERQPHPNGLRDARRPSGPPARDRKPEQRRQVFNNPFAVLAGLKVPPKK
jgi:hypothetical protein